MRIVVMRIGALNQNPIKDENLMKSVVMLVEEKANLDKAAEKVFEKIDYFENTKQKNMVEAQFDELNVLSQKFMNAAMRERMILNQACSNHQNFKLN